MATELNCLHNFSTPRAYHNSGVANGNAKERWWLCWEEGGGRVTQLVGRWPPMAFFQSEGFVSVCVYVCWSVCLFFAPRAGLMACGNSHTHADTLSLRCSQRRRVGKNMIIGKLWKWDTLCHTHTHIPRHGGRCSNSSRWSNALCSEGKQATKLKTTQDDVA